MGAMISLTAADGHGLSGWLSEPATNPKGGIVVLQEIFGVNSHIRDIADRYAAEGYLALAPSLFDRIEPGFECGYSPADREKAFGLLGRWSLEPGLLDVAAALTYLRPAGKLGVTGFCLGGMLSWLSASRLAPDAAVGYYASRIGQYIDEQPKSPVMLHFGRKDSHIPLSDVAALQQSHPTVPVYLYDSEHGFACDQRGSYDAPSAQLAWRRTLDFFADHLGG